MANLKINKEAQFYATIAKDYVVKQYALGDFFYFTQKILGYDLINEDNQAWCRNIQSLIHPILGMKKSEQAQTHAMITKFMRLYPRETFKSTIFTVALPIWLLLHYPNLSIILGSKVNTQAESFLQEIKGHYELNRTFRYYFGDWTGSIWQDSSILVVKRTKTGIKEPSIRAVGMKTTLTGVHVDLGLIDDLVTEKDRDSVAEREKSKLFFKDFEDLIRRGGVTLVVGTHWHRQDAYNDIKQDEGRYRSNNQRQFWDVKSESCWDENRKPRYKVYTRQFLEDKLLKKGRVNFAANYENRPLAAETELFPLDKFATFDVNAFDWSRFPIYGYCDPALGRTKSACYAPIITAAFDDTGPHPILYIIDADVKRRSPSRIMEDILIKNETYHYTRFRMESVGFQDYLRERTEEESFSRAKVQIEKDAEGQDLTSEELFNRVAAAGLPVEDDTKLVGSKEARIEALEYPVSAHMIQIREDWLTAPGGYSEFMDQMTDYPIHTYKDAPDCLAGLWRMTIKAVGIFGGDDKSHIRKRSPIDGIL